MCVRKVITVTRVASPLSSLSLASSLFLLFFTFNAAIATEGKGKGHANRKSPPLPLQTVPCCVVFLQVKEISGAKGELIGRE